MTVGFAGFNPVGMDYEATAARAAYVAGVVEAIEASVTELSAPKLRELDEWVADLRLWTGGPPPPGPHWWA